MKKRIVKRSKLRKEIKIAISFLTLVYLEFMAIIRGLELNNDIMIFGGITLINIMMGMLLIISKEK